MVCGCATVRAAATENEAKSSDQSESRVQERCGINRREKKIDKALQFIYLFPPFPPRLFDGLFRSKDVKLISAVCIFIIFFFLMSQRERSTMLLLS